MEKDLKQMLRSVLKEELNPINRRLSTIEKDIAGLKQDVSVLKQDTAQLKIETAEIKLNQEKYNKDMIETMGNYTDKLIQEYTFHTEALNKRVFRNESELEYFRRKLMELGKK